jgi:hypothetical protein
VGTCDIFRFARGEGDDDLLLRTSGEWSVSAFDEETRYRLPVFRHGPVGVSERLEEGVGIWGVAIDNSPAAGSLEVAEEVFCGFEVFCTIIGHEFGKLANSK